MESSIIEFQNNEGKTVLTKNYSVKPLKIMNPSPSKTSCYCMLTNYGGGFVQGDTVKLNINCGKNSNSVISSQANTRVYEGENRKCAQEIETKIESGAFHVYLNDPLVLHKNGNFVQKYSYDLEEDSILLLSDWFVAGRTESGESYAFNLYKSDLEIRLNQVLVLKDKFKIDPINSDIQSPALLGKNITFVNVYLIGNEDLEKIKLLENGLNLIEQESQKEIQSTINRINQWVVVARFASEDLLKLKKIVSKISNILGNKSLLGFDPLERKY